MTPKPPVDVEVMADGVQELPAMPCECPTLLEQAQCRKRCVMTGPKISVPLTLKPLGLDPPRPREPWESPVRGFLGSSPVIEEGRATFEALVPDRFKKDPS